MRVVWAVLAACCLEADALLPARGRVGSRTASVYRTPSPASSAEDDDVRAERRKEAERLALQAERASLEAEALEMELQTLRAAQRAAEPEPPPPAIVTPTDDDAGLMSLRAPLRWIGPYPAVALSFPALSSPAQKARLLTNPNEAAGNTGVTLDFILDTAANTNTIGAQVTRPVHRVCTACAPHAHRMCTACAGDQSGARARSGAERTPCVRATREAGQRHP